jgi:hypothetical protein
MAAAARTAGERTVIRMATEGPGHPSPARGRRQVPAGRGRRPRRLLLTGGVAVTAAAAVAAPRARITSVAVRASFDDGRTWHRLVLRGAGSGRWTTMVTPPRGSAFVSLSASLTDAAGNSTQQTVIRAYSAVTGPTAPAPARHAPGPCRPASAGRPVLARSSSRSGTGCGVRHGITRGRRQQGRPGVLVGSPRPDRKIDQVMPLMPNCAAHRFPGPQ